MLDGLKRRLARWLGGEQGAAVDGRSGRMVVVIHCILNQNVRDAGAATLGEANWAVLDLCRAHRVGVMQLPCPESACLGLARRRPKGVELRAMLETEAGRRGCRHLALAAADQIADHARLGHQVLAVLGGNRESPGCAVHHAAGGGLAPESGVFMLALAEELAKRGLHLPFRPLRDGEPERMAEDLVWVERRFQDEEKKACPN